VALTPTRLLLALLWIATSLRAQDAQQLLDRGQALDDAGRLDEAVRDYTAARDLAERTGARKLVAQALTHLGYIHYYRGETNTALVELRRAYDIATTIDDPELQRTALSTIAHVYADTPVGQYDRAIEYYRQLLPLYEAAGEGTEVADTLYNLGSTLERKGDLGAALEDYRRALAAEEKLGRRDEAAYVKRSIGTTLVKLDRAREALPLFESALRVFRDSKDGDREAQVRQSRGVAYRRLGRLDEAFADLEASRAFFATQNNTRFLEKSEDELALAYSAAGRWEDAFRSRTAQAALQKQLADKLRADDTARLRVQFDSAKKEQENRALARENAAAARIRRLQTIILILGGVIIVVLVALAFRLVRNGRRMRTMAMTDELTRLPNRRHLLTVAHEELRRTRGSGDAFSLVALDLDHFKRINDTWGHHAGDVVLQRVAHACRTVLRPGDRIGRTGGEEFTVLLPSTSSRDALTVADRLRIAVEAIDCTDIDPSLRVTISLGVAEWSDADGTLDRITARADEALYRAKERGRNRVELDAVRILSAS
jgi:diguanylate cyclase (GGDEF)-like protein